MAAATSIAKACTYVEVFNIYNFDVRIKLHLEIIAAHLKLAFIEYYMGARAH